MPLKQKTSIATLQAWKTQETRAFESDEQN